MRIAISTGGGDAPGLNAVIRAVVLSAHARGWECYGIRHGFESILDHDSTGEGNGFLALGPDEVRGITHLGGTILGASNRGNPFRWAAPLPDGSVAEVDRSDELVRAFRSAGIDALVIIGGDGSLKIGHDLSEKGIPVVGVPKTIDNDVFGTEASFGFDTAVSTATDAIDKLHSTAESHDRVMVVELMGRYAGWIALNSGVSGSADVILIPEIPFRINSVCAKILERESRGRRFSIVVVAEGARPVGGDLVLQDEAGVGRVERLGGIGAVVAEEIATRTGKETRSLVLGHLQRGGSPTTFDRLLALRFGAAAVGAIADGRLGTVVVYAPPDVEVVPLSGIVGKQRLVPVDSGIIQTARSLGTSFGD